MSDDEFKAVWDSRSLPELIEGHQVHKMLGGSLRVLHSVADSNSSKITLNDVADAFQQFYAAPKNSSLLQIAFYGLPVTKKVPSELKLIDSFFFVASGRSGGPIKSDTLLFPHELAPHPSLFLIGSFYPPLNKDDYLFDDKLLYLKQIDYSFSQGPMGEDFVGTSRSVATGLAKAVSLCPNEFHQKPDILRKCLDSKKLTLKAAFSKKTILTLP